MREPTNYFTQSNRCPNCSHKKKMHGQDGCNTIIGNTNEPALDKACKCKGKWVSR